ncbi:hypothetical protein GCM10011316_20570 [Roseibium aquae]|uniref:Uncharacterized protein n=1 Tax=Roseibium aquae TaxID=1323746 RepID=A0A916TJG4_9HYPH|nr:hypothetical protein [Roseibium aquae]GGB48298.1 hypothetical protein GCM10011316_20570 [Roseibium aquae]
MTKDKETRRSTGGSKPMKSYGFLSHGGPVAKEAGTDPRAHHKSRGAQSAKPTHDGKPEPLGTKPAIGRYRQDKPT